MKNILLTICLLLFTSQVFAADNISVKHEAISGFCFTTIDIQTTEEWLNKQDEVIILDHYPNIRRHGFIMDMFYSNAGLGKAQWIEMNTRGIYVMSPGALILPISNWAESGMGPNWRLRITMLNPLSGSGGSCQNQVNE